MANRSDWNASLPRQIKRMISSQHFANAHERGECIRIWVEAHKHAKHVRVKMLASRGPVSTDDSN